MSTAGLKTTHIGKKIERIRELKGMKQETLATEIGVTQQAISKIEQSETVDEDKLERIARALGISAEAIKAFNEDATVNYIANTFNGNSGNYINFNPLEKIIELYDKLLKEKDDIIEMYKKQQRAS